MSKLTERFSTKQLVFGGIAFYLLGAIIIFLIFGSDGRNDSFEPQSEFELTPLWGSPEIKIGPLDLSFNKAVLLLLMASVATVWIMTRIAKKMEEKPNKVQMAMEWAYDISRKDITRDNMDAEMAARWFPFTAALFFWILASNILGFLPLPINSEHPVDIFGVEVPPLAIYAATANISVPLILTLVVWIVYNVQGVIYHGGPFKYLATWLPPGLEGMNPIAKGLIFAIEVISHVVRLVSLSVRLFANMLAGHLLLLFMGGGLAIILGISALGWVTAPVAIAFFLFEVVIVAGLQAFIFAILTGIYLGSATSEAH